MKNKKTIYRQRMYTLVLYNLSSIQKGIQSGHANDVYQLRYGKTPEFKQWINNDLTVIILDGGSSDSLTKHINELKKNGIKYHVFVEPDLYKNITAVSFLVDERVWDKVKYPKHFKDFTTNISNNYENWEIFLGKENVFLSDFLEQFKLAI